jgi:hypothetical protein
MARLSYTQISTKMYFLETMAFFEPGSDPEYYRRASMDGQDRCMYTWGAVIPIETSISPYSTVSFPMQKLVAPHDSLVFEDKIYSSSNAPFSTYFTEFGKFGFYRSTSEASACRVFEFRN